MDIREKTFSLEFLERTFLFVALFVPLFVFFLGLFSSVDSPDRDAVFETVSWLVTIGSVFLFLIVAIINSYLNLRRVEGGPQREALAAKATFFIFLFLILTIAFSRVQFPLIRSEETGEQSLARWFVFLVYTSLAIYSFFIILNRASEWIRERAHLLVSLVLFCFFFSWLFWLAAFGHLEEKIDDGIVNGDEWETLSELSKDLRDFDLLEQYIEKVFPKGLGFEMPKDSVVLRIVPLVKGRVRIYFVDDRGIEAVEATYSYGELGSWSLNRESGVKLLRRLKFD